MGAPNLLLAPGAIEPRYGPGVTSTFVAYLHCCEVIPFKRKTNNLLLNYSRSPRGCPQATHTSLGW